MITYPNNLLTDSLTETISERKDGFIISGGLTKREYFSVLAMQALVSNVTMGREKFMSFICRTAVAYADSLISELNKGEKDE